jgi:hypothetical protein
VPKSRGCWFLVDPHLTTHSTGARVSLPFINLPSGSACVAFARARLILSLGACLFANSIMSEKGAEQINLKVREILPSLALHLRSWAEQHLIQPRRIKLSLDPEGNAPKDFWLVTDHNGKDDSTSRVVYDN